MRPSKATKSQVRRHNRQLVLRAVYTGAATSRAALAQETDLTKPTISDLVAGLMDEGLLVEEGLGESTDTGGKRPRLLRFIPEARQVIGVALNPDYALGVLTNLDGRVIAQHQADLPNTQQDEVLTILVEVINGLIAQLSTPLLCLSIGISGIVDSGVVRYAPRFGWHDVRLARFIESHFRTPVYLSNSTELAARAQFAFGEVDESLSSLATILINNSVGVGAVLDHSAYHTGSEIGFLTLSPGETALHLERSLAWYAVRERARVLGRQQGSAALQQDDLSYLHIRHAAAHDDPAALALQDELAESLAYIFAWIIALLRPDHISVAGSIANLGEAFLERAIAKTCLIALPELVEAISFSLNETPNLVALGAAAKAIQEELGLV